MHIEIISDSTIKVSLNKKDFEDFDIKYSELNRTNPKTREFLLELLEIIQLEKGVDLCSEKLFIEAFISEDGGCLIYISATGGKIRNQKTVTPELTCEVFSPESLPLLARKLFNDYSHILHESDLYEDRQCFRLILTVFTGTEERLLSLLREYGTVSEDSVHAAYTREHFKALACKDAVERLAAIPRGEL